MSSSAKLFVVIADFDGWDQTKICLQQLEQSSYKNWQAIVVDHGTTSETAAGLASFPACIHLKGGSDLWWAGATNLGINEARSRGAEYIMLLNNDCYVDADTVATLLSFFESGSARIVAPIQRDLDSGNVVTARLTTCFTLGFPTVEFASMRKLPGKEEKLFATPLIQGGRGVVIPAAVFDQVGVFDEAALPHYAADHDFYLRCRTAGIGLFLARDANVAIDDTRTSTAQNIGAMNWSQFKSSLRETRSHRNIDALKSLFKLHYPVRPLYLIGVYLNLGRYFLSYCVKRSAYLLRASS